MADSRRWDARSGSHRDDQFTRAPTFRDGADSDPLSADKASWYGGPHHRVSFAVGFAILAGIAAVAFMALAPGSAPDLSPGGSAAEPGGGLPPAGNSTLPSGLPTPSLSGTPTGVPVPTPSVPILP